MNMERVLAKLLTFPGHLRTVQGGVTYVINVGKKKIQKNSLCIHISKNVYFVMFLHSFFVFENNMAYLICPLSIEV